MFLKLKLDLYYLFILFIYMVIVLCLMSEKIENIEKSKIFILKIHYLDNYSNKLTVKKKNTF